MKRLTLALASAAFALSATLATAAEIKPAIVYDLGGKFDKSFNEGVYNGAEKFKADTGVAFQDFEIQNDSQREQALAQLRQEGLQPDRRRRLLAGPSRREGRRRVPRHQVRHHRHGGRQAERPLHRLQGA